MLKTMGQIWPIVKSIVLDRKLISCWLTLLALHILGILILYDVMPEFDLVNHFLFGFLISESVSKGAHSVGLHKVLTQPFLVWFFDI